MPRWYTFAIALCLILMLSLVANAQTVSNGTTKSDQCLTAQGFVRQVRAAAPELQIVHFVGSRASALIARYAALPPINEIPADEMIVVFVPEMSEARSVFLRDGCAIGAGVIRLELMRRIMREVLGEDA